MADFPYDYIVVVQCHLVKQRCSGYFCEKAFHERKGGFADLPAGRDFRVIYMDCGGCCGKAVQRKLTHLARQAKKDGIGRDRIVVQLASCITKDNYHSPRCPTAEYIQEIIARTGIACREDTVISDKAAQRRRDGTYRTTRKRGPDAQ